MERLKRNEHCEGYASPASPQPSGTRRCSVPIHCDNDVAGRHGEYTPSPVISRHRNRARALLITEGSSGAFTVKLDAAPTAEVTVSIRSDNAEAAAVSPESLKFTSSDYGDARTVTVSAKDDSDADQERVTLEVTGSAVGYDNIQSQLIVSVAYDEEADALVSNNLRTRGNVSVARHAQRFTPGDNANGCDIDSIGTLLEGADDLENGKRPITRC